MIESKKLQFIHKNVNSWIFIRESAILITDEFE